MRFLPRIRPLLAAALLILTACQLSQDEVPGGSSPTPEALQRFEFGESEQEGENLGQALARIGVNRGSGISARESALIRKELLSILGHVDANESDLVIQPYDYDPAYQQALLSSLRDALEARRADGASEGMFRSRVYNGARTDLPRGSVALYASQNRFVCSGTVIGPRSILTAAHCFCGTVIPTEVRLDTDATSGSARVRIAAHRCYAPCSKRAADGDVAVVEAVEDLKVKVVSIASAQELASLRGGSDITFVGFGETGSSSEKGVRRMQDSQVLHSKCEGSFVGSDGVSRLVKDTYDCAGPHELVSRPPFAPDAAGGLGDVCKGDSGGTVLVGRMFESNLPQVGPVPPSGGQAAVIVAQVVPGGKFAKDVCGGYGSIAVRLDPSIAQWIGKPSSESSCTR